MRVTYQSSKYHPSNVTEKYIRYVDDNTIKGFDVDVKGYTIREYFDVSANYPLDKVEEATSLKDKAFNQVQL